MSKIKVTHGLFKCIVGKHRYHLEEPVNDIVLASKIVLRNKPHQIITLPVDFNVLLVETAVKYQMPLIEFTYGYDPETGAHCITWVHPEDHFVRSVGYQIVTGKLKKNRTDPYPEDHEKIIQGE
ncbi:MAG: hypothetical protein ACOC4M_08210 [Promethearchaeia archaeon]